MSLQASDIKFFKTLNGLGGAITNNEIVSGTLGNVFDDVDKYEARDGDTEYRCIYVRNTNLVEIFKEVTAFLKTESTSNFTSISFGLGTAAVGGIEQTIADESTAPIGVVFTDLVGAENGKLIGDINNNSFKAIWLKRVVTPGATSLGADTTTISVDGSTVST